MDGFVPIWGRMLLRGFSSVYFGLNLGAGAFLFTTRRNFEAISGFDEQYFAGEEVYFSIELKKLGAFKVLREPVITSGRKLRMYPAKHFLRKFFGVIVRGSARSPFACKAQPLVRRQTGKASSLRNRWFALFCLAPC